MKCPFELPVRTEKRLIITKNERRLGTCGTQDEADYIVTAINSHEKLVNACEKAKWLYDELALSSLGAACKYGDNYEPPTKEDCLNIRELFEQALKESGEPK